jgi:hypothetical protein
MKPGWKTTEFWVTIATTLWAAFGHALSPAAQAVVVAVVPGVYTAARAVQKAVAAHADAKRVLATAVVNADLATERRPPALPSPSALHQLDGS